MRSEPFEVHPCSDGLALLCRSPRSLRAPAPEKFLGLGQHAGRCHSEWSSQLVERADRRNPQAAFDQTDSRSVEARLEPELFLR